MTIRIIFVIGIMARWYFELNDVKGAFLNGEFESHHKMYMKVPYGCEQFVPPGSLLLLLKAIYGTKQAAIQFWKKLCAVLAKIGLLRSKADPCLHFKWDTSEGLTIMLSWVDDMLCCGRNRSVHKTVNNFKQHFHIDELGELKEYVGCQIEYNQAEGYIRMTQPVMIQSFEDEFELPNESPVIPSKQGSILVEDDGSALLSQDGASKYRTGVGKLLHMMKWSRNDILNSVRELSRFMKCPREGHLKAMYRTMNFVRSTREKGNFLKPNDTWDGNPEYHFQISGATDSEFASNPDTRRTVIGVSVFLADACISACSRMLGGSGLSVTETELYAAVDGAQDMLFALRLLEDMGLKVELPMILKVDNKGCVDLANGWSN